MASRTTGATNRADGCVTLKKNQGRDVTVVDADKRISGDVVPSFKWRHTAWIEELGISTRTSAQVLAIADGGVKIRNAQGEEEFLAADTVTSALERRPNQELFDELEWMIDEVHGWATRSCRAA